MNYPVSDVQNSIGERAPQLALIEAREAEVAQAAGPGRKRDLWLLAVLAVITLAAALYNFVIATPRYVSDMSFVLRTPAAARSA